MAKSETRTLNITAKLKDEMTRSLGRVGKAFVSMGKTAATALRGLFQHLTSLKGLLAGVFAFIAVRRAWGSLQSIADDLDNIIKSSDRLQITTESLSALRHVADLTSVNFDTLSAGLAIFSRNVEMARRGSGEQALAFRQLGLSMENLPLGAGGKVDIIELLAQMADGLQHVEDPAKRVASLLVIFGEQGAKLGPALAGGGEAIRQMARDAEAAGLVFDRGQLERAAAFNDALTRVSAAVRGIQQQLFLDIAPGLAAFFERIAALIRENRAAIVEFFRAIGRGVVQIADLSTDALIGLIAAIESIPGVELVDQEGIRAQIRGLEEMQRMLGPNGELLPRLEKLRQYFDAGTLDPDGFFAIVGGQILSVGEAFETVARLASEEGQAAVASSVQELVAQSTRTLSEQLEVMKQAWLAQLDGMADAIRNTPPPPIPQAPAAGLVESSDPFADLGDAAGRQQQLLSAIGAVAAYEEQTRSARLAMNELRRQQERLAVGSQLLPFLKDGTISMEQFSEAIGKVDAAFDAAAERIEGSSFLRGVKDGANAALQAWTDFTATAANATGQFIDTTLGGLGTAFSEIITGTKSAKEAFKEYGAQILRTIAQIIPQLVIVKALRSLLGPDFFLADGGVTPAVSQTIPLRRFADGGVARRPTLAIFGEAGEEAFVPLKHGHIPVKITGAGGGGQMVFAPVINAVDAPSVRRLLLEQRETIAAAWQMEFSRRPQMQQAVKRGTR